MTLAAWATIARERHHGLSRLTRQAAPSKLGAVLEARSRPEFRRAPVGGCVSGERWLYFCFDRELFGYVMWGHPGADDVRSLVSLLELELDRAPHRALVDFREVEVVTAEAFASLAAYTVEHQETLGRIVTRSAIVRPSGLNGAIVTGFFDLASKPFPVSFWKTRVDALFDLGSTDAEALAAQIDEAVARVSGEPALLRALHAHLLDQLASADIAAAAQELGLSARTLQRRLSEHGTSFQAEVQGARLRAAQPLLAEGETSITAIALDLGFATPQHFSTLFRKQTGLTPSAFRAQRQK